jgi:hypothetical protein
LALIAEFIVFAAPPFVSAGTVFWPAGWTFMAIFFGYALVIVRRSPRRWRRLAP